MADDIQIGRLSVPVVADFEPIRRQARGELKRTAEAIGQEAGRTISRNLRGDRRETQRAAEQTVKDFLDGVRRRARVQMADAREELLRGLIDEKEFEKRGRDAAEAMNQAILDEIERRANAGELRTDAYLELSEALKVSGRKGGEGFGQEANRGARAGLQDLQRWLRGGFVVGVVAAFAALASQVSRMFQRVATAIRDTLEAGGAARTVRTSFESVAGSRGADPAAMLTELRKATRSTAADLELMRRATFALNAGLPATAQQMGELANIARRLGAAVGVGAAQSFERLADGIAKGRSQTLQELGIMTRRTDALREWERQTGRNSAALSEQEKVLIHLAAVLEEGREKVQAMGEEADEAATPVQQLSTLLANFRDSTAEAISSSTPVVDLLTSIGDAAAGSAAEVEKLANYIAAYVATAVELSRKYGEGSARVTGRVGMWLMRRAASQFGVDEGEIAETFTHHVRMGEIRAATDLVGLRTMEVETLEELVRLKEKGVSEDDIQVKRLREQNDLIKERVALLTAPGTPEATGGPAPDQIAAAEAAVQGLTASMREFETAAKLGMAPIQTAPEEVQAAVRELVQAQEQVRAAEEQIAAIRAGGMEVPAAAQAYLDALYAQRDALREIAQEEIQRWQRELPLIITGVEQSIGARLPALLVRVDGAVRSLGEAVGDLRTQADAIAEAERDLMFARMAQDPERAAAAEKRLADERQRLRTMTAALARALAAAGIPAERLNEILEEMNELLEGAGVTTEAIAESGRDWEELARTFEGVARGVLSIADAMDILDARQRQALQGAIDLASGIATGGIGGTVQAIGGAAGLLRAVFSGPDQMPIIESQANLIRALDRLRDAVLQDVSIAERERLLSEGGAFLDILERVLDVRIIGTRDVLDVDSMSPEALAIIQEIERLTGIEIFKDDQIWVENFRRAMEALEEMDLAVFGHGLQDRLDGLNWIFRSLGDEAGDAAARLERFLGVVGEFAPDFTAQLQEIIDSQGHDAAMAWVQALAEAFGTEGLSAEIIRQVFGSDVSARDVQRIIDEALGFIGGGAGLIGSPETRMAVNITQAQGSELLRIGSTQLYHLAGIHSLIAEMVSAPPPVYGIPDLSPPSPASLGIGTQTMVTDLSGMTVEVHVGGGIGPGNAHAVGVGIGEGIGEAIDQRIRRAQRGGGATGRARVRVEVDG